MVFETKDAKAPETKQGGAEYIVTIMLTLMGVLIVLWWIPPLVMLIYAGANSQWSIVFALVTFFYWQLNQTSKSSLAQRHTFLAAALAFSRSYLVPLLLIYLGCKENSYRIGFSSLYVIYCHSGLMQKAAKRNSAQATRT